MAEKLRSYDWPKPEPEPEWGFWLGGAIVRLEAGRDFKGKPRALVASARRRARKEGKSLRVAFEGENKIVIQAIPTPEAEAGEGTDS